MGGASSGRRGAAYERELVDAFRRAGWGAIRLPSSGSATERELPDVLAGRNLNSDYGQAWAVELKSGKATTLYVDGSEVADLNAFSIAWGTRPFLGARPTTQETGREFYLLAPDAARRTDGGAYGLPVAELEDRAFAIVGPDGVDVL